MSIQQDKLTAIANAIRAKKGTTAPIIANDFASEIDSIPTGSQAVLGTKSIMANGTYTAVDDSLDGYSAVTVDVSGGEEPIESGFRVRFIDYEGTILKTEYVESGNNATPPDLPTHDNLAFKEWNNPYTNVTRNIDTGAFYTTTPGNDTIYLDIYLDSITGLSVEILANNTINGVANSVWYDWGDGTTSSSPTKGTHTYASKGWYTIKMNVGQSSFYSAYNYLGGGTSSTPFIKPQSALIHAKIGRKLDLTTGLGVPNPNSITLNNYAFYKCNNLETIQFPTPCNFSTSVLSGCNKLKALILPNYNAAYPVTSPGSRVLSTVVYKSTVTKLGTVGTGKFESIELPPNADTINSSFLNYATKLKAIDIPSGIATIPAVAFANCFELKKIIIRKSDAVVTLSAVSGFTNINYDAKIYVPDALVDSYKVKTNWALYADYIYPLSEMV